MMGRPLASRELACGYCAQPLPARPREIRSHMKAAHPGLWAAMKTRDSEVLRNASLICGICGATFLSWERDDHLSKNHPGTLKHRAHARLYNIVSLLVTIAIFAPLWVLLFPYLGAQYPFYADFFLIPAFLVWVGMRLAWLRWVEPRQLARARAEWQAMHPSPGPK